MTTFLVWVGAIFVAGVWAVVASKRATKRRLAAAAEAHRVAAWQKWNALCAHFGEATAARIANGDIWQGQTLEMLIASLGNPSDVREKLLKTKHEATLYYFPMTASRYALKVFLENGFVVGWERYT